MKKILLLSICLIILSSCINNEAYKQTIRNKYPKAIILDGSDYNDCYHYIILDSASHDIRSIYMDLTKNGIRSDYLIHKYLKIWKEKLEIFL